jgi:hypothetical protein
MEPKKLSKSKPELSQDEKLLLLDLEYYLGSVFYNANIRNYEGRDNYTEGREFRYPLTGWVKRDEKWEKEKPVVLMTTDSTEKILNAGYILGANEFSVFRGLYRAVRYLKSQGKLAVEGFDNPDV